MQILVFTPPIKAKRHLALNKLTLSNGKIPVDLDLGCSVHLLPKLSELRKQEVFTVWNGHPVVHNTHASTKLRDNSPNTTKSTAAIAMSSHT